MSDVTRAEIEALTQDDMEFWLGNKFVATDDLIKKVEWWASAVVAARVAAAEREALERAVQAILDNVPYGYGMNPDGTEDRIAMAYVEGNREAWQVVRDLMPRKDGE